MRVQAAVDLAGALSNHPTVTALNLSSVNFFDIARFLHGVRGVNVPDWNVTQNALTTDGVEMLIEALKNHPTLEQLHLNNVRCGTKGCNAIFTALVRNRVLKVLSLGLNDVRASFCTQEQSRSCDVGFYTVLCFQIHDSAAVRITNTLALNPTITSLDLSFNRFTDEGIARLASGLEVTSRSTMELRAVDLDIQLVGNPCTRDEYILPGLARSKLSHKFAKSRS
jgi:hypothetical protein